MEIEKLGEIGLTFGEVKVYTALLRLGVTTKGPIAKQSNVSESKVYEILDRLKHKGLVSYVLNKKGKRNVRHYKAANPVLLKKFLNLKKEKIEQQEKIISEIIPQLQATITKNEKEYSAVIYEGFKGIQTNCMECLEITEKNDEWLAMGGKSSKSEHFNSFWISFFKERARKGGNTRFLFVDNPSEYTKYLGKIKNCEVRFLKSIASAAVAITKDRVMIFSYENSPGCLTITNNGVAESFKGFFESLWQMGKST